MFDKRPFVDGKKVLCSGVIKPYGGQSVDVKSPIIDPNTKKRSVIGRMAQLTTNDVMEVLHSSKVAWNDGLGEWPQMTANDRVKCLEGFIGTLKQSRDDIIHILMWEIGKSFDDSQSEFDRTVKFMQNSICEYKCLLEKDGQLKEEEGYLVQTKRGPVGVVLSLGPYNYPLNESYTTLFPALLVGNVAIFKIPSLGGLTHVLAMEAFAKHFPPGVINYISGSGRELMGPLMNSGAIDALSFIGSAKAADSIIKEHPAPHRLRTFLQLESKNLAVVLPGADLEVAAKQIKIGATSYNGQRCTAIKLVFVHKSLVNDFLPKLSEYVSKLKVGMPWEEGVFITPLPEEDKCKEMCALISDAQNKGAKLVNENQGGGQCDKDNLLHPAILFPVTEEMRLWHEEQFGPVIPIAEYDDINDVYRYLARSPYGQQASVFTQDSRSAAQLIDVLANTVCRININTQCGRSPDNVPFTGRRSSALGTMSVRDALEAFSVDVVLAAKQDQVNEKVIKGFETESKFLQPLSEGQGQGQGQGGGNQKSQSAK